MREQEIIKTIMSIVNEEVNEKIKSVLADKHGLSLRLFIVEKELYETKSFDVRKKEHELKACQCCKYKYSCDRSCIPTNVGEPIESDKDWLPIKVGCGRFEWD